MQDVNRSSKWRGGGSSDSCQHLHVLLPAGCFVSPASGVNVPVQVQSFDPYRDVATLNLAPDKVPVEARQQAVASAKELVQACATLRNVHQQTYATVSEVCADSARL